MFKTTINESRADKLALNYLKSKGVTDYNEQMRIIGSLKHDIPNLRNGKGKFVLGALRCYFDRQLTDYQTINAFDKALGYIFKGNHQDEYDENLNGASVEELTNKYKDLMKGDLQTDVERSNSRQFQGESDYKIIPINSFEEARQYSNYTSWCVTKTESAFDQYTSNGAKRFYFCLKNGFENTPQQAGENAPLDNYGLSMISVLIDNLDGGSVDRVTTRWNHDYNGENNPNLSTAEQLEDVLNVPFYQVFKPYTRDELHQRGIVLFDEVQELLDGGRHPREIFDVVGSFREGFATVRLNNKMNWIDTNGQLLSPGQWFDDAEGFQKGLAAVKLNDKFNWVDKNGQLLSPGQWFDEAGGFREGFATVKLNDKFNWVDMNGQLLNPGQWFDEAGGFREGFATVKLNDKFNWVDMNGQLLNPGQWFDEVSDFQKGFARLRLNNKWNWINKKGKLLNPNQWFDFADEFREGFARIIFNGKWNWFDKNMKLLSPGQWFDWIEGFQEGFAMVKLNGKWNWFGTNGKLLSPGQWFDVAEDFYKGFARADLDGYNYYVDKNGIIYDYYTEQPLPDDQQPNLKHNNFNINNLSESIRKRIKVRIDETALRKAIREMLK